ncbi:MAG: hypothetical protein N2379_10350 [Verrucomicrobiae bacterium]|nr:hypothetical protein [Verrucomicrobiae bacterium]
MSVCAIVLAVACAALFPGCATDPSRGRTSAGAGGAVPSSALDASADAAEPEVLILGRIVKVHSSGRFALVSFPFGCVPRAERPLYAYRDGQKVAELRTTYYALDELVVADIVSGECKPGDTVSDR